MVPALLIIVHAENSKYANSEVNTDLIHIAVR